MRMVYCEYSRENGILCVLITIASTNATRNIVMGLNINTHYCLLLTICLDTQTK